MFLLTLLPSDDRQSLRSILIKLLGHSELIYRCNSIYLSAAVKKDIVWMVRVLNDFS